MRRLSHDTITLPELAQAAGITATAVYALVEAGKGPFTRPHGKLRVVPLPSAIHWLEHRLRRTRLSPSLREKAEDAIRDLRVDWAFVRAASRRRAQHSARSRYGVHVRQEGRNAHLAQEAAP